MVRNEQLDHTQHVSTERRRRLRLLYLLVAVYVLSLGTLGMLRVWREVGRPFGGFLWGWDPTIHSLVVDPQTPWDWPGPQHGLRGRDRILAANGRPSFAFSAVYAATPVGEEIAYLVGRGNAEFTVRVPLSRFTPYRFFKPYVLAFLTGISCLVSGYALVRSGDSRPVILMGFALLALSGTPLYHSHNGSISHFYLSRNVLLLLFIPSYPLAAAIFTHLFLVFPQPLALVRRRRRIVYAPYLGAVAIGVFQTLGSQAGGLWNAVAFWLSVLAVTVGMGLPTARSLWSFFRAEPGGRARVGGFGVALAGGLALLLGAGVLPFFGGAMSLLLTDLVTPLVIVYPLAMVYAVRNAELIGQLRHEIAVEEQLRAEARELRGIREPTLHEVADALHDTVISDVRGLQLWLTGVRRRAQQDQSANPPDLSFVEETLEKIYQDARRIMEGAKPVDFAREGLFDPLKRSLAQFQQADPRLETHLEASAYDENYAPAVKEQVYWIIQTALANSRDHAKAQCVTVRLRKAAGALHVTVQDDGTGFDLARVMWTGSAEEHRRLGLRNMQMRTQRLGAVLEIDSTPPGTTIELAVPLNVDE